MRNAEALKLSADGGPLFLFMFQAGMSASGRKQTSIGASVAGVSRQDATSSRCMQGIAEHGQLFLAAA
jgi:hypothetical protein